MERFWEKVDRGGPDECWPWRKLYNGSPYGMFHFDGAMHRAHRIAWRLERGEIPEGMCVLHRCDNPPCVNPTHLWLGTRADNNADRDAKARFIHAPGSANGNARLTEEDVLAIRRLATSHTGVQLAVMFNASRTNISRVIRGETWVHV